MPVDQVVLIYDGACGMCDDAVALVRRWDRDGRLTCVPFQDEARVAGYGVPLRELAAAMHVVLPDGRVYVGAGAAPEILRRLPGKAWIAALLGLPGVMPAARRLYAWIAARRRCGAMLPHG